jgi:hypothetical protein
LISAQYGQDTIEARMQFFAGPKLQLVWRLKLGANPSSAAETCGKGFSYVYFDTPDKEGYTGAMTPLQPVKSEAVQAGTGLGTPPGAGPSANDP